MIDWLASSGLGTGLALWGLSSLAVAAGIHRARSLQERADLNEGEADE